MSFSLPLNILLATCLLFAAQASDRESHQCAACAKPATLRCTRCRSVWYCGKDCHRSHWKTHKKTCQPAVIKPDKKKEATGAGAGAAAPAYLGNGAGGKISTGKGAGKPSPEAGPHEGLARVLRAAAFSGSTEVVRRVLLRPEASEVLNDTDGQAFEDTSGSCPICLEDYPTTKEELGAITTTNTKTQASVTLPCGHRVHYTCQMEWDKNNPDQRSSCPLCRLDGNIEVRKFYTPLMLAASTGHSAAVSLLLAARADVSRDIPGKGVTALGLAAMNGSQAIVRSLLEQGEVPTQNPSGALRLAARGGHTEIAGLLLEAGADPSETLPGVYSHQTALVYASNSGHTETMRLLLQHRGVPASSQNPNLALVVSAQSGRVDDVRLLLDAGADPTWSCPTGSALVRAAAEGHLEVVRLLLQQSNMTAQSPVLAINIASSNGHETVAELIKQALTAKAERDGFLVMPNF